jgi:hypothetical protein
MSMSVMDNETEARARERGCTCVWVGVRANGRTYQQLQGAVPDCPIVEHAQLAPLPDEADTPTT